MFKEEFLQYANNFLSVYYDRIVNIVLFVVVSYFTRKILRKIF